MKGRTDFALFDIRRVRRRLRRLKSLVGPPDSTFSNGSNPLVIGGCARSGTTLLQSALSAHPSISVIPHETQAFCHFLYYGSSDTPRVFELTRLQRYFGSSPIPRGTRYWCEKTPRNIQVFADLLDAFGRRVRLLQIVRDGRDVICSRHPDAAEQFWVPCDRWVDDVTVGLPYLKHPQVMTVRYEDLVLNFKNVMLTLYDFLELSPELASFHYPEGASLRSSNAWPNSAVPIHSDSIGRWRRPEFQERIEELMNLQGSRELLETYGYLSA